MTQRLRFEKKNNKLFETRYLLHFSLKGLGYINYNRLLIKLHCQMCCSFIHCMPLHRVPPPSQWAIKQRHKMIPPPPICSIATMSLFILAIGHYFLSFRNSSKFESSHKTYFWNFWNNFNFTNDPFFFTHLSTQNSKPDLRKMDKAIWQLFAKLGLRSAVGHIC